ncbi:uncharacterized protein LOC131073035 isoform X1 [Cryptomeria japonica]|uniref:uncharacterized protein LOC131073035 isoform X1 n=1 Tax=Cryptomeria japonica TaxID=3369 RepID=UPI0027DA87B1|nr:uncharacterized protein LOC131073035 isoform X1 [Cryptomeria japonica]
MTFFDLNIPVEQEAIEKNRAKSAKNTRVKLVVKAMELGYSGIAYNRYVSGIIADTDRCTIISLPLSSLVEASPALAENVKFHREVLGLPVGEKMRQYSRVTVGVENMLQAAAVNPKNPVLCTYDLLAVHPMNLNMFEHACLNLEVDLISLDLSQKLPFHLKSSLIRAAVQRGVFFEVMYSPSISNVHARREMFKQVQILIEWTHGRNIIVSSAAPSVNELRGPNDVMNMSTLFGLSKVHAKKSISMNCRSLILRGLTRKNCYKMAIQVSSHPPDGIIGSDRAWFNALEVWDPISSGEGDVVLKENLVVSGQLKNEKSASSRGKKRSRGPRQSVSVSSSHNNSVLLHQKSMRIDPDTSICGLRLKESKLTSETNIKEQNPGNEEASVFQSTRDSNKFSFSDAMEFLPFDCNTKHATANGIEGTLLQTNDALADGISQVTEYKSITNKNMQPSIVTIDANNKFSFSSATEFLPFDHGTNQVIANCIEGTLIQTGGELVDSITDLTDHKSNINKNMQSCDDDSDAENITNITPSSSLFSVGKGPVIPVTKGALKVCRESSLPSDYGRDSRFIKRISVCDNASQREVSELKPHGRTIGVEVQRRAPLVLGSDIEMNGLKDRANEMHNTEPNVEKIKMDSYDVLTEAAMSTKGVVEESAACVNADAHMELIPKTGIERKLRRQKLDSITSLSLRGMLKSGLFKKKVQSRTGSNSNNKTRKKR